MENNKNLMAYIDYMNTIQLIDYVNYLVKKEFDYRADKNRMEAYKRYKENMRVDDGK